ncbi:MAG: hypothetical protein Q8O32_00080 [bacterium]|nr:hypothetical protein [bacterium]
MYVRCLKENYLAEHGSSQRLTTNQLKEVVEPIAETTKSRPETVLLWVNGKLLLEDEAKLRLACHLERRGFQLIELEGLNPSVREILEEISLKMLNLGWTSKKLGFKSQQDFLAVLSGSLPLNPVQVRRFAYFIEVMSRARRDSDQHFIDKLTQYLYGHPASGFNAPIGVANDVVERLRRGRRNK